MSVEFPPVSAMNRSLLLLLSLSLASTAAAQKAASIEKISPSSALSSGGTEITITGSGFLSDVQCLLPCPTTVTFGTVTVPLKAESDTRLVVITPAHAPGPVNLVLNIAGDVVEPVPFLFTPDEDDAFEMALVPVHVDGVLNGVGGSRWQTDFWVRNSNVTPIELAPWPCEAEACATVFPPVYSVAPGRSLRSLPALSEAPDGNPSRLVYVARSGAAKVSFGLRFADTSRASLDGGVELPIVREQELLAATAQLFNVPLGRSFRVLLRIYETHYTTSRFRVSVYPQSEDDEPLVTSMELTATSAHEGTFRPKASYAQFDITRLLEEAKTWPETVRIEIEPLTPGSAFWAFASLTNNETQTVTLVTPQ